MVVVAHFANSTSGIRKYLGATTKRGYKQIPSMVLSMRIPFVAGTESIAPLLVDAKLKNAVGYVENISINLAHALRMFCDIWMAKRSSNGTRACIESSPFEILKP